MTPLVTKEKAALTVRDSIAAMESPLPHQLFSKLCEMFVFCITIRPLGSSVQTHFENSLKASETPGAE